MKVKIAVVALIGLASAAGLYQSKLNAQGTKSVWDGVYTKEQADNGKTLYAKECGSCHGDQLTGGFGGGIYRSNSFSFSYNGSETNQGILIGNLSTNITYSPSVSGAINAITGFGIAASLTGDHASNVTPGVDANKITILSAFFCGKGGKRECGLTISEIYYLDKCLGLLPSLT